MFLLRFPKVYGWKSLNADLDVNFFGRTRFTGGHLEHNGNIVVHGRFECNGCNWSGVLSAKRKVTMSSL